MAILPCVRWQGLLTIHGLRTVGQYTQTGYGISDDRNACGAP